MRLLPIASAALMLGAGAAPAAATTQLGDYFSFSGFGTLGVVRTNSDEGKFGRDRQPGGADKDPSFDVDSNLGLQLTGTATSWLSGTVQLLTAKRDRDEVEPRVEWAYVSLKPIPGLSIRAGRMALPTFAISDSRNIGYANTWVRAPNEVYGLNLFRTFKGGDITYRSSAGPATLSATLLSGKTEFTQAVSETVVPGNNVKGVNLQVETEWATFRYGKMTTDVTLTTAPDLYTFSGFGVTVDRDNIVAQAESVQRRSHGFGSVVDSNGWYAMGGYRFGAVVPYAIVSSTSPRDGSSPFHLTGSQKTRAIGVRWDAFASAALKFQVERIDTEGTAGISFTSPTVPGPAGAPPSYGPLTHPVTALSATLDFVF